MIKYNLAYLFLPIVAVAQEHGHTHGEGGEIEHLYPILVVFVALVIAGVIFSKYFNKKK